MLTLGVLAEELGATLYGNPDQVVTGLATLAGAGPQQVSFLANRHYLSQLRDTRAAAVILHPRMATECPVATLQADDPYLAFARATALFVMTPPNEPGVHPTAIVAADAQVHPSASVGPHAVIGGGTRVEAGAVIGALCHVGARCVIAEGSQLYPGVVLYHDVKLGKRCTVHSQAVLGADGFGFAQSPDGWEKIHQLGGVTLGNDVEVGACTTIDRGALEDTVVEDGVIIDNLVQIAHNCHIGKNTAIAGCSGLAGSTIIGANCTLAGGVGVVGHVEICDNVHITGMTMVTKSITEPGSYSSGTPMSNSRDWKRNAVRFAQLDRIQKRLAVLENTQKS